VPKSRVRKKSVYTPPASLSGAANRKKYGSPLVAPFMVACFLIGIIWLVTYYASNGDAPIPAIHAWNLLIGFGFGIAGFILSTRWR
jgi:hypothetical protein